MKKIITFLFLFGLCVILKAQVIALTNSDCSTDGSVTSTGISTLTGFTVNVANAAVLNASTSGISGGTLNLFGTTNGAKQGDCTITTDKIDISSYPTDAIFVFHCQMTCETVTSAAQPYNVTVIAYAADGITTVSGATATITKVQPNTNTNAGVAQTVGASASMHANATTPGQDAKYIAFQLQIGKMITNNLKFDDFTLAKVDALGITTVDTPSNAALSYEVGNGPSTESTFNVSGDNLGTDSIVLSPGPNLEISTTLGSGFVSNPLTLSLAPIGGSVATTTIYVRLKAGISGLGTVNASSARVSVVQASAGTKTVQFTGTVNGIVAKTATGPALSYIEGSGPSPADTIKVQGYGLNGDLLVTPGINIEISTSSAYGFASTPITLPQTSGEVVLTPVYARLKADLSAGVYIDATTLVTTSSTDYISQQNQLMGTVDTKSAVNNPNQSNVKCTVVNGSILINEVDAGTTIEIYNSVGAKIKSVVAANNNEIQLTTKGLFVVKAASFVQKVVVQ